MMRLPSVKAIAATFDVTMERARQVRKLLEAVRDEHARLVLEKGRVFSVEYHRIDVRAFHTLEEISPLIGGHGVEALRPRNPLEHVYYINQGDAYRATIIWDAMREQFRISSWGDMVERYPRRFE